MSLFKHQFFIFMYQKRTYGIILALCAFVIGTGAVLSDNGKAGYAKSPGENSCSSCHSGGATTGSVTMGADMTNWEYVPGQTYNMTVTVSQTGMTVFGLCTEALTTANVNAGTLIAGSGNQVKNNPSNNRKCITHVLNGGAAANTKTFDFTWTAPVAGTGNVTFYTAAIAGNKNGQTSGDAVYTMTQVATEKTSVAVDETFEVKALQIAPNPVTDWVNITTTRNDIASYHVIDMNGKEVMNVATAPIFVASLPTGMYFLQAMNKENQVVAVERMVKK